MASTRQTETPIGREVERLFGEISAERGDHCTNPVTGGDFVYGFDSIKRQKDAAYKRLLISEYFALKGPPDAPRMPTDDYERNRVKHLSGLLGFVTAQFIWSLENQHDLTIHPSFADFASGLLWQHETIGGCTELSFTPQRLPEMKRRYPPRKLEGLEYFCWRAPCCVTRSALIGADGGIMQALTFRERMKEAAKAAAAESADPWRLALERVHGKIGDDGIERITTQTVFDILEIPQRNRSAGACRHLANLMTELGWTAVRVRGLTRGGYKEQVRGYCRDARHERHQPS